MDYIILVGLGNPGFEYETTRHNVGFHVIDVLCNRLGKSLRPGKGEYLFASGQVSGRGILLVKPMTYMNNSGTAVGDGVGFISFFVYEKLAACGSERC